jgi:colanic acid/amylovoran biosynthesis glycosyltransferase
MTIPSPPRIIYVLERFPGPTLNFVYNEIRGLEEKGLVVEIHSLLPGEVCPVEAEDFLKRTHNLRTVSAGTVARAWGHFLARKPGVLMGLIWGLARDNEVPRGRKALKTLGHLLYAVVFAWKVRGLGDHIHAHFAFKAATAALVASRLNGQTFSFTSHGSATVHPPSRYSLPSKIRGAYFIVAVSNYNKGVMAGLCPEVPPSTFEVNRTGILLGQFPFRTERIRRNGPLRILCVATLYPEKNHAGLLRACGLLMQRGVDFKLDLVGRDDLGLRNELEDIASSEGIVDRVQFQGGVDHGEIQAFYGAADVCILTSHVEGVPVTLMEAMSSGVPVVGPRITGVPELVKDGETGLLVDPGDEQAIADALARLANDPDLGVRLADAARLHIEAEFDMERNAAKLATIFADRLSARGREKLVS